MHSAVITTTEHLQRSTIVYTSSASLPSFLYIVNIQMYIIKKSISSAIVRFFYSSKMHLPKHLQSCATLPAHWRLVQETTTGGGGEWERELGRKVGELDLLLTSVEVGS